jgi:hypothetical protein
MIALALALMVMSDDKPVRSVDLYVTPLYSSAAKASKRVVRVDPDLDPLLRSDRAEDVLAAQERVRATPANVSPLAMMVLASRLYDVGARDDSVFWFYVAKDRFMTMSGVLTGYDRPGMFAAGGEARAAMGAFVQLAGPTINGYAFCDIDNQQALRRKAYDWVAANPYQPIFDTARPAKGEDRQALLDAALGRLREDMANETAYLTDSQNRAELIAGRKKNGADTRFCW